MKRLVIIRGIDSNCISSEDSEVQSSHLFENDEAYKEFKKGYSTYKLIKLLTKKTLNRIYIDIEFCYDDSGNLMKEDFEKSYLGCTLESVNAAVKWLDTYCPSAVKRSDLEEIYEPEVYEISNHYKL